MAVFKRLPGTARRYVDLETGLEYSDRQVKKLRGKKSARSNGAVIRHKQRLYYSLRDSFIQKQINEGKYEQVKGKDPYKGLRKKAQESKQLKQIIKDLKSKDPFLKLHALKQTTRRDGVPDTIPIGETPAAYSQAA